jgi:hypothetical protein
MLGAALALFGLEHEAVARHIAIAGGQAVDDLDALAVVRPVLIAWTRKPPGASTNTCFWPFSTCTASASMITGASASPVATLTVTNRPGRHAISGFDSVTRAVAVRVCWPSRAPT